LVRITRTNISGSDLHMYEGRTDMKRRRILSREIVGEVIEVGPAVDRVKFGDMGPTPAAKRIRHPAGERRMKSQSDARLQRARHT